MNFKKWFENTPSEIIHHFDENLPHFMKIPLIRLLGSTPFADHRGNIVNTKPELYRTLDNEKGKYERLGDINDNDFYDYRNFIVKELCRKVEIRGGECENSGGVEITVCMEGNDGIKLGLYFGFDSIKIASIQSIARKSNYSKLTNILGSNPHEFMFILASFIGFELGKDEIKIIKQKYSEYAHHKKGDDVSKKLEQLLGLKNNKYRYYRNKEIFLSHLSSKHPNLLNKYLEVLNNLGDIQPLHGKWQKILYQEGKENTDLKGELINIIKKQRRRYNYPE